MPLHESTFEYLKPTDEQIERMTILRRASDVYARAVDDFMPTGPDKTYALRKVREIATLVVGACTRKADGSLRT